MTPSGFTRAFAIVGWIVGWVVGWVGCVVGCVAGVAAVSGCASFLIDTDEVQCAQASDCANLGFPGMECVDSLCTEVADTAFSCRDAAWPTPSGENVRYTLTVANLVGQTPYEGLTIQACPNLDTACASPFAEATTDAAGSFTLDLQEGFQGHLFAPPPAADPMLAPLKVHIFPPPSNDPNVPRRAALAVTSLQVVGGLAMLAEIPLIPGTGHVFFTAIDCQGMPLEGVTVSPAATGSDTFVAYLGASGSPDLSLLGTGPNGQGAIINVPPGFVTVRGVHESEGKIFEQSAIIAADTITSVPIVPSPTP